MSRQFRHPQGAYTKISLKPTAIYNLQLICTYFYANSAVLVTNYCKYTKYKLLLSI